MQRIHGDVSATMAEFYSERSKLEAVVQASGSAGAKRPLALADGDVDDVMSIASSPPSPRGTNDDRAPKMPAPKTPQGAWENFAE
eukprot:15479284-Alexandrium_andersonii.AAC.1